MHEDFLFADDAAVVAHSAEDLQQLMNHFRKACQDFGLTISRKKTQVMGQGVDSFYYHLQAKIGGCS